MLRKFLVLCILFCLTAIYSMEKLDQKYLVTFGDSKAPVKVTKYFSFSCPQCMRIYNKEFKELRDKYYSEVQWVFHPYPKDMFTVQSMACFENLSEHQKRVLMEALCSLVEVSRGDVDVISWGRYLDEYMQNQGLDPIGLSDSNITASTEAFYSAYAFINQGDVIREVPTIEVNDRLYDAFPTREFMEAKIKENNGLRSGR